MRVWFSGRTLASQARYGGSIPLTRLVENTSFLPLSHAKRDPAAIRRTAGQANTNALNILTLYDSEYTQIGTDEKIQDDHRCPLKYLCLSVSSPALRDPAIFVLIWRGIIWDHLCNTICQFI